MNWSTPFTIPEFTEEEIDIEDIIIRAKARNEFNVWSEMEQSEHPVGLVLQVVLVLSLQIQIDKFYGFLIRV